APRVRQVELPLARVDLDPDVRTYSWLRARHPARWLKLRRKLDTVAFPEPVFGSWRETLEKGAEAVHRERPVDLVVVSPAPYTTLAAAWHLHEQHGVPYVVDFRDAWSLDVMGETEHFPVDSRRGRWERKLVEHAIAVWAVNDPIAGYYRQRYPAAASAVRVVRNGWDADIDTAATAGTPMDDAVPGEQRPITVGYLGTAYLRYEHVAAILEGWAAARTREPLLAGARLVFRGHLGAGMAKGANALAELIAAAADDGVEYGGPVAKADVGGVYRQWDALLLAVPGGRYMTTGKVYEYLSTGLPIISSHEREHDTAAVLEGYPLWARCEGTSAEQMAEAFVRGARLVAQSGPQEREAARRFAGRYERRLQVEPVAREVTATIAPELVPASTSGPAPLQPAGKGTP
ncbi:MAG TPA: hypothetical protein VE781_01365, partial [Kineosporiaceae bacterium]|nr:hypothetical protein [Kineosporiaceae bacterium]